MSLRTRILLFLFIFALVPLLMAVVINLPLVLERVDSFYRQSFLQNLRQDFRDLDQHLASRDANVRLLARLPEPSLLGDEGAASSVRVDFDRARYTAWINRILDQERDIIEIRFLDAAARERFWLARDPASSLWQAPPDPLPPLPEEQLQAIRSGIVQDVAYSPVRVHLDAADPRRIVNLQMMGPVRAKGEYRGAVVITIDISDLVRRDPRTLWVLDDGSYLRLPGMARSPGNAFTDHPGLEALFTQRKPVLWESAGRRMIWVPMFVTESGRPLWVGREVDLAPLEAFRSELVKRVLVIVFALILLLLIAARILARRVEQIGSELIQGIRTTLESASPVTFDWRDTRELEQLSADLTRLSQRHAIQARRLQRSMRELEQSNRYKSEFLANVSHELRTPLNSILLLSKMLSGKDSGLCEEQREQAWVIHKAGSDLKNLIDNILDHSRIEAGKVVVHCEEVEPELLLEEVRELMQPQFDQKGLRLVVERQPGTPPSIRSDADKIRQILKNFISNALKFTDSGEVCLIARPAQEPHAIELAVRDTGIGIPQDKQAHIFEAFQQADGSTSRRYGGTGLGLTISRQLARLLGGDLRLRSVPGQGSEFSLLLPPRCDAEAPGSSVAEGETSVAEAEGGVVGSEPPEQSEVASAPDLRGRRALLVEADVRTQLRLSQALNSWGAEVSLACDAEEALETLDESRGVELVVLDPHLVDERLCDRIGVTRTDGPAPLLVVLGEVPPDSCVVDLVDGRVLPRPLDLDALRQLLLAWNQPVENP
jgi:signal transduction histidine kinase